MKRHHLSYIPYLALPFLIISGCGYFTTKSDLDKKKEEVEELRRLSAEERKLLDEQTALRERREQMKKMEDLQYKEEINKREETLERQKEAERKKKEEALQKALKGIDDKEEIDKQKLKDQLDISMMEIERQTTTVNQKRVEILIGDIKKRYEIELEKIKRQAEIKRQEAKMRFQ